jgi:hypothetical protein
MKKGLGFFGHVTGQASGLRQTARGLDRAKNRYVFVYTLMHVSTSQSLHYRQQPSDSSA